MDAAGTPDRDRGPDAPDLIPLGPVEWTSDRPGRLSGVDAAKVHVTLAVGLVVCGVAFWFEIRRALGGNGLSWAYVFEWPLFAVFAVYMWWTVLHGGSAARRRRPAKPGPAEDPRYAGMLEAWQAHQRELQAAQAEAERAPGPDGGAFRGGGSGADD
jgi:hypothetical protein